MSPQKNVTEIGNVIQILKNSESLQPSYGYSLHHTHGLRGDATRETFEK